MIRVNFKNWVLFIALLTALFFSTLLIAASPIVVKLKVVTTGGVSALAVEENKNYCKGGKTTSSCIKVTAKTAPFMNFKLENACKGTGYPEYELTGMRISQIAKVWPTADNPLNAVVAKDFKADPDTGEIDFHYGKNKKSSQKLKFKNHNSAVYTVFYEISAAPCDDASNDPDIHLDPEIRNKGKG